MLADHADVNIGMIRYYFGNKNGLFSAMLDEVMAPIKEQVELILKNASTTNVTGILTRHYQIMANNPMLPTLMYRIMTMPEDSELRKSIMCNKKKPSGYPQKIFNALESGSGLQPGVDPQMAWLSVHSLMMYPFLIMPVAKKMHGNWANPEFLEKLAEHNSRLLTQGLFKTDN